MHILTSFLACLGNNTVWVERSEWSWQGSEKWICSKARDPLNWYDRWGTAGLAGVEMEWRSLWAPAASQPSRSCVGKRNEWRNQREGLLNESRPGGGKRWRHLRNWQSGGKWTWGGAASRAALRRSVSSGRQMIWLVISSHVLEETEYLNHFGIVWLNPHSVSQWCSYFKKRWNKGEEKPRGNLANKWSCKQL